MNSNSYNIVALVLKDNTGFREQIITDETSFRYLKNAWVNKINKLKKMRWRNKLNKREWEYMWGYDDAPFLNIEIEYNVFIAYDVKESQLRKFNLSFVDDIVYKKLSTKTKEHFEKEGCGEFLNQKEKHERFGSFNFVENTIKFLLNWGHTIEEVNMLNKNKFEKQMKDLGKMDINHFNDKLKIIKIKREFNKQFLESDIYNPQTLIGRFEMNKTLIDDEMGNLITPWVSPIYINKFTAYIRR
jgi:hypothetical protein